MDDSPERELCHVLLSFFNPIHLKLLNIGRVIGGATSDTRKNFLTDSHKLNLSGSLKYVCAGSSERSCERKS